MARVTRDKDVFPIIRLSNETNKTLVIEIPSRILKRIILAPKGQTGASTEVRGIDFRDRRVRNTLRKLYKNGNISATLVQTLAQYLNPT